MEIRSHSLKLTGRAELLKEIEMGHNYDVALSGSVTSVALHDNDDGTANKIYTFKPVKVEVLTDKGERLVLRDVRSRSQQFRAAVWRVWNAQNLEGDFEVLYDRLLVNLINHAPEVVEMFNGKL
jgi:hypothetical protein